MTYIKDLMNVHTFVDEMFFDHQKALLHFEFDKALKLLEMYQATLIRHMQDEELILLPVYADRAQQSGAGAPKLFFDDHEKMSSFIKLFLERIAEIKEQPDIDKAVLQILDREAFYLRLCSHHDKREAEFLYPILEEILTDAEKRDIMSHIDLSPEAASIQIRNDNDQR